MTGYARQPVAVLIRAANALVAFWPDDVARIEVR